MIALECVLARLTGAVGVPPFALGGQEQILHDVFEHASGGDIQLSVNNAALSQPLMGNQKGFWALICIWLYRRSRRIRHLPSLQNGSRCSLPTTTSRSPRRSA